MAGEAPSSAAASSATGAWNTHVYPLVKILGAHAKCPNPAYALAALCAAASPFGLGGGVLKAASAAAKPVRVVPPFWQLVGFSGFFALGGYMIQEGDVLNGSGVVTAWSLTYLTFKTLPVLRSLPRSPVGLVLSGGVAFLGLTLHGCYYFDKASWKGAIPGLIPPPRTDDAPAQTDKAI